MIIDIVKVIEELIAAREIEVERILLSPSKISVRRMPRDTYI